MDDTFKPACNDDVYPLKYYRWVVYTAEQAVEAHRQTHHPSMYNVPDALVYAQIDFNMEAAKKVLYQFDNFFFEPFVSYCCAKASYITSHFFLSKASFCYIIVIVIMNVSRTVGTGKF